LSHRGTINAVNLHRIKIKSKLSNRKTNILYVLRHPICNRLRRIFYLYLHPLPHSTYAPPLYMVLSPYIIYQVKHKAKTKCLHVILPKKVGVNGPPHTKRRSTVGSPKDSHSDNIVSMVEQGKPVSKTTMSDMLCISTLYIDQKNKDHGKSFFPAP